MFSTVKCEICYINSQYVRPLLARKPYDLRDTKLIKVQGNVVHISAVTVCAGAAVTCVPTLVSRRKWVTWKEQNKINFSQSSGLSLFLLKGKYLLTFQDSVHQGVPRNSLACHHMQLNSFNVLAIFLVLKQRSWNSTDWLTAGMGYMTLPATLLITKIYVTYAVFTFKNLIPFYISIFD